MAYARTDLYRGGEAVRGLVCLAASVALLWPQANPKLKYELKAISPKFNDLIAPGTRLETVATGFGFTEGPVWNERGFLYVSDEVQNKIYRVDASGRREMVVALGDPDGNTYDLRLRLVDCASVLRAIIRVSPAGEYTVLADR